MKQSLKHRALFTLDGPSAAVFGTYHKPYDRLLETDVRASSSGRLGLIFVNSLSTPRSGYSDSAIDWADAFAASGYPVFRIDLPGLGDTAGQLPPQLLTHVTGGGYAAIITQKIREIVAHFGLSGAVIVGHCAGAVTALHAASEHKLCRGLILMDPYFNHPKQLTRKLPPRLVMWSRNTRIGSVVRKGYGWARELSRTEGLPSSTNFALLRQWKQVASRGLPILVLQALSTTPSTGHFDYLDYALAQAGSRHQVEIRMIGETDHSFSNQAGRKQVRSYAELWLKHFFPIQAASESAAETEALQ